MISEKLSLSVLESTVAPTLSFAPVRHGLPVRLCVYVFVMLFIIDCDYAAPLLDGVPSKAMMMF